MDNISDGAVRDAIAETEAEIIDYALGNEGSESEEVSAPDRSMEQVEGWDGRPLSNQEQWETTLHGHRHGHGFDRPLEHGEAIDEFENTMVQNLSLKVDLETARNEIA